MRHVTWCAPLLDIRAAYMAGTALVAWAPLGVPLRGHLGLAWDDPLHFLRGTLWAAVRRCLAGIWRAADTAGRVSSGMLGRSLRGRR